MMRWMVLLAAATAAVLVLAAVGDVQPVLAATSQVGKRVGDEVHSWAKYLILGVAALVAIPVLARRDVSGGVVLVILVILVGGFAFAPEAVMRVITSLWRTLLG
jgi:hypothetical protein